MWGKKREIKSGDSLCVWQKKRYMKCVCFYGSRQMYFCSVNISIEMQKEIGVYPSLKRERKKLICCSKGLKKYVIGINVLRLCNGVIYEYRRILANIGLTPPLGKREKKLCGLRCWKVCTSKMCFVYRTKYICKNLKNVGFVKWTCYYSALIDVTTVVFTVG